MSLTRLTLTLTMHSPKVEVMMKIKVLNRIQTKQEKEPVQEHILMGTIEPLELALLQLYILNQLPQS